MWLVNLISCFVFAAFLAREMLTVALGLYPSSGWLWRLSFDFGYDLIPFLHIMSGALQLGVIGTIAMIIAIIALIAAGAIKRDHRSAFVSIHAATLALGLCWLSDAGNRARLSSMTDWAGRDEVHSFAITSIAPLTFCLCILMIACVYAHVVYIAVALDESRSSRNSRSHAHDHAQSYR